MIAALYVATSGPYFNHTGIDPWDINRDARLYDGPHRVIAHPPCERWGRYWGGGPSAKAKRILGDDGGCFIMALLAVRQWGGVLEHPEASHAWPMHGLAKPPKSGGWILADGFGGWTCCVEQGHYGHAARKATWLYAVDTKRPELIWGPAAGKVRMDAGFHSREERAARKAITPCKRLSKRQRVETPVEFRDLLISIVE